MKLKLIIIAFLICNISLAQKKISPTKPKLVLGIVVDQMRYDFLYRFYDKYSEGGFKRLMNEGFNCRNNQYHYASTVTGPGHGHIYTGSVPAISGLVGNDWYEKNQEKTFYVVDDSTAKIVGEGNASAGKMSPKNMKVSTIGDQLKIASQFKSKVVGVALKDRGAILPAGHTGLAFWYESSKGNWITSDYYLKELPNWVLEFNKQKLPEQYVSKTWEPLMPLEKYTETEADDQPYEATISGEKTSTLPHKINLGSIASSYFGNEMTRKFAMAAFEGEQLGKGDQTDILAVSFSSPDYVGHYFGPQSKEIQDVYLRLDLEIAEMLKQLDKSLGMGNYSVFLTADHGVAEIPAFLAKNKVPAGLFLGSELKNAADKIINQKYGEGKFIKSAENYQLYLNKELLSQKNISVEDITKLLQNEMTKIEGVYNVINLEDAAKANVPSYYKDKLMNLYNPKRSGEVMVLLEPAWLTGYNKGTTHGTMFAYDTHVPLIFYGFGFQKGQTMQNTYICDIAPTLAQMLKILEPNGSVGSVIEKSLK